jgi:hypothetical protein
VRHAVLETLSMLGFDLDNKPEMRADMAHLRRWRKSVDQAGSFGLKAFGRIARHTENADREAAANDPWNGLLGGIARLPNAISQSHAETDVFQQAAKAGISGGEATLYVDRKLCDACGQNGGVRSLARQLGLSKLTVITPEGTTTPWP